MTAAGAYPLIHLVLGDEDFLAERAVKEIIGALEGESGQPLEVTRLRAGEVTGPELAELLSPSLFGDARAVILEALADAGKEPAALVEQAARQPTEGIALILMHSGGGRQKALAPRLEKAGATVHRCMALKRPQELQAFVRAEFQRASVRVPPDVTQTLIDAVGKDLRALAAAASQLASDTGGVVDATAVQRYYQGIAEVSGFEVADAAVSGRTGVALTAVRWALSTGVAPVLIADALAESVHAVARVAPYRGRDSRGLAGELGMNPWRISKAQEQARGWTPRTVGQAIRITAEVNGAVKGGAADAEYALETAVRQVSELYQG